MGDILQAATQVLGLFVGGKPVSTENKHTQLYTRYQERLKETKAGKR